MTAQDWISRSVSILRPRNQRAVGQKSEPKPAPALVESAQGAIKMIAEEAPKSGPRSTRERLSATLRQKEEALSPRVLRRTLEELRGIVDARVSEIEGGRRAQAWPTGTAAPRPSSAATCGC